MSGLLAAAGVVGGAVSALFGGGGDVLLGNVTLMGGTMEVPERINWGGKQHVALHVMPGGDIVAHSMGIDYAPIEWRGILLQADATDRARQISAMHVQGDEVELSWLDHDYKVLIEDFNVVDLRSNWAEYSIRCRVTEDLAGDGNQPQPGLLDSVLSDVSSATGITLPSMTQIQGALSTVQQVLTPITALTGGALAGVQGALNTATGVISLANGASDTLMGGFQAAAAAASLVFPPAINAQTAASNVTTITNAAGTLAAGKIAYAYTNRALKNVNNVQP